MRSLKSLFVFLLAVLLLSASAVNGHAAESALMGVDVSYWNGRIDWAKAAEQIDFAMLCVGNGTTLDSQFEANAAGCATNEIPFGVYLSCTAANEGQAVEQAQLAVAALEGHEVRLPVFVDLDYMSGGMSSEELCAVVRAFCDAVMDAGYEAGIYTQKDRMEAYFSGTGFDDLQKWIVEADRDQCSYAGDFVMWQYSWSGRVAGITGDASCNYYYGDLSGADCEHENVSYSYVEGIHSFTCADCGEVFTKEATDSKKFAINSAAPVLSDDIVMKYSTTVPAGFENAYMVFDFNGESFTISDYEVNTTSGRYEFKFPGINPQKMGDNICATLYAEVDGVSVSVQIASYSMVKNCDNQLKKSTLDDKTRTMLSDVLMYGEKAQIVTGYKTDVLVTSLLSAASTLTPSTYPESLDASVDMQKRTGTKDDRVQFTGVTLSLGSKMAVRVAVTCTDTSLFTYKVTISGREYTYTGEDLVPVNDGSDGKYYLFFNQMKATEFGEKITFTCWEGDTQISYTIEYSVYTFICRNMSKVDANTQELLKAIYNYGESVK